jgi:hypothetical protein
MFFVTGQKRSDRLTICQGCEHFVQSTKSCGPLVTEAFTDSKLCGCHMPTKTRLKVASCPLGKWEAEIKESDLDAIRTLIENPQDATNGDLAELYSKATGTNTQASQCSSCNRKMFNELKQLLKEADKQ